MRLFLMQKELNTNVKLKKEVPSDDSIYCIKCHDTFDSIDDLNDHTKNKCYTKYSYTCLDQKCTKTFSQKSNMQQHYYTVHLGKRSNVNIVIVISPTLKLVLSIQRPCTKTS